MRFRPDALQPITRRTLYILTALLLVFSTPLPVFADDELPAETEATTSETPPEEPSPPEPAEPEAPVPPTNTGPEQPTGTDAHEYKENEDGTWENDQYIWDPVTGQTKPKVAPEYSYNPTTKMWDTVEYRYDAASGSYVPNTVSVPTPPSGAKIAPSSQSPQSDEANQKSATLTKNTALAPASSLSDNSDSSGMFDLFYNALISNNIKSSAHTGDALVNLNTLAGNALSGDATAIATIFNLIQTSWGLSPDMVQTFAYNLFGDIVGDLFFDPGQINTGSSQNLSGDTTINSSGSAAIHNKVTLDATSGDATVSNNTEAGDAESGKATAIANIVNAINSSIAARQSFIGMLNIYGNLDGDILLPQNLIDALIAANTVATLETSQISNAELLANFTNNGSITNNIDANAQSGDATVANNTSAGGATSGKADTNITVLNLTGRQVVGKNALLVFVNVLGKWVGVIVDAPQGATSAALGGGLTENSSLAVNSSTNQSITNDISVNAQSGDATVANNTSAGGATSGDAKAAVNLLNLNGSQLALSDWFGVLFINVFGTWNGSFGIDTPAGTLPLAGSLTSPSSPNLPVEEVRAFQFIPEGNGSYHIQEVEDAPATLANAQVLGNSSVNDPNAQAKKSDSKSDKKITQPNDWLFTAIGVSVALSLLGTERVLSVRHRKSQ